MDEEKDREQEINDILAERYRKKPRKARVFCVGCGALNRTLHKWYNSYLCSECFKIARNVGDEQFIKALKGED